MDQYFLTLDFNLGAAELLIKDLPDPDVFEEGFVERMRVQLNSIVPSSNLWLQMLVSSSTTSILPSRESVSHLEVEYRVPLL